MAELKVQNQQATKELAKARNERDATANQLVKLEMLVAELRNREARSKKLAIEEFKSSKEFKSSEDFQEAIKMATFKYFGQGLDFCKWQLHRYHPDLGIDLEGIGIDHDLIEEEEEAKEINEENKEKEKENKEKEEEKGDTSPFSP